MRLAPVNDLLTGTLHEQIEGHLQTVDHVVSNPLVGADVVHHDAPVTVRMVAQLVGQVEGPCEHLARADLVETSPHKPGWLWFCEIGLL